MRQFVIFSMRHRTVLHAVTRSQWNITWSYGSKILRVYYPLKTRLQPLPRLSIAGSLYVTFLHAFEVCCWMKPRDEVTLLYTVLNVVPHGNKGTQLKVFFLFTNWCTSDFFKKNIKIYIKLDIKIAPTCFVAVTPSSGSALIRAY